MLEYVYAAATDSRIQSFGCQSKKDVYNPLKMWYNYNINETLNECEKLKTTVVERHGSQDDALTID
jgi:hypothetical protein